MRQRLHLPHLARLPCYHRSKPRLYRSKRLCSTCKCLLFSLQWLIKCCSWLFLKLPFLLLHSTSHPWAQLDTNR
jgi:hypothetical protein